MSKKVTVKPKDIRPSQNFLRLQMVRFIQTCIDDDREDEIPESPIVREIDGHMVAVDGHNMISVFDENKRDIEVFVVESADDIPEELKGSPRAKALETKFGYVPQMYEKVRKEGIVSFPMLRKIGEMKSQDEL